MRNQFSETILTAMREASKTPPTEYGSASYSYTRADKQPRHILTGVTPDEVAPLAIFHIAERTLWVRPSRNHSDMDDLANHVLPTLRAIRSQFVPIRVSGVEQDAWPVRIPTLPGQAAPASLAQALGEFRIGVSPEDVAEPEPYVYVPKPMQFGVNPDGSPRMVMPDAAGNYAIPQD